MDAIRGNALKMIDSLYRIVSLFKQHGVAGRVVFLGVYFGL